VAGREKRKPDSSPRHFERVDEIYVFHVRNGRLAAVTAAVEDNLTRLRQLGLDAPGGQRFGQPPTAAAEISEEGAGFDLVSSSAPGFRVSQMARQDTLVPGYARAAYAVRTANTAAPRQASAAPPSWMWAGRSRRAIVPSAIVVTG
jgi:hypothetical protein